MSTSFNCQKHFEILMESTSGRLNNKGRHRIEAYVCKQFLVVEGKDPGGVGEQMLLWGD